MQTKEVQLSDDCPNYGGETEDIGHMLFLCPFTRLVCGISGLSWSVVARWLEGAKPWLRSVHYGLARQELEIFLTVCWALWGSWEKHAFEGQCMEANEVSFMARHQLFLVHSRPPD
ncbi:hypothetical protein Salat_0239300 [Sesamum alatum]|uniref:Reverse transcriptase zinc-binding domain-containing protein n=1 Tax=Sesamum alatum TaxID=300844 RepID=A0AAE1YZA5_9LAMI|nr:hypothetical protein Salat_0239300 [Sesamum alatum]